MNSIESEGCISQKSGSDLSVKRERALFGLAAAEPPPNQTFNLLLAEFDAQVEIHPK